MKPNTLDGQAIWLRQSGQGHNPDKAWETSSLPLGNGSLGANILGSVAAERITLNEKTLWERRPQYSRRSRLLLERKQAVGTLAQRYSAGICRWRPEEGGKAHKRQLQRTGCL